MAGIFILILEKPIGKYDTSETTTELIGDRLAAVVTTLVKICDKEVQHWRRVIKNCISRGNNVEM